MTKKIATPITPRTANTTKKLISMKRDNIDYKGFWILVDEDGVCITEQNVGEKPKASIRIPKTVFNRLVKFYETGK